MSSVIILAAGESRRFGSPKALVHYQGKSLVENLLETYEKSDVKKICVVLGFKAPHIESYVLKHKNAHIVYNKDYKLGQTSSFLAGLNKVKCYDGPAFLHPVDVPFVRSDTINQLLDQSVKNPEKIIIPVFHAKRGHPPLFPQSLIAGLLAHPKDQGINQYLQAHKNSVFEVDVLDKGISLTFNTPPEWQEIQDALN